MSKKSPTVSPMVDRGFALWGNQNTQRQKRLIEFRAGKMYVKENMVYPDLRKGQVYIYQGDDSAMHFCWMERAKGVVEDDMITMPGDCWFKRIKRCTTGRVYLLKMKSSNRSLFYWMQEPSSAKDLDICNRVNSLLNFPPPRLLYPEEIFNNELRFILNQLNAEQLQALYNGDNITLVDTRHQSHESRYIESFTGESSKAAEPETPAPFVDLGDVLTDESIKGMTKRSSSMNALGNKLPPVEGSKRDNLEATIKSIPFKHSMSDFSMALRHGTLGPQLREMGVNSAAVEAADNGDVDGFVKALQGGAGVAGSSKSKPGGGGPSSGSGSQGSGKNPNPSQQRPTSESQSKNERSGLKQVEQNPTKESRKRTHDGLPKIAAQASSSIVSKESNELPTIEEPSSSKSARLQFKGISENSQSITSSFEDPSQKDAKRETTGPILELLRKLDSGYHSEESQITKFLEPENTLRDVKKAEFTLKRVGQWLINQNRRNSSNSGSSESHETQALRGDDAKRSRKRRHNEVVSQSNKNDTKQGKLGTVEEKTAAQLKVGTSQDILDQKNAADKRESHIVPILPTKKELHNDVKPQFVNEGLIESAEMDGRCSRKDGKDEQQGNLIRHGSVNRVVPKSSDTKNRNVAEAEAGAKTFQLQQTPAQSCQDKINPKSAQDDQNTQDVLKKPTRKRPHDNSEPQTESEQQTEPVTIRSMTGVQAKVIKKAIRSSRTDAREDRTERSQNTDPVRIEEKQKRQQKSKDQKQTDEKP